MKTKTPIQPQPPAEQAQPQVPNPEMGDAYSAASKPFDMSASVEALGQQQQRRVEFQNQQVRDMKQDPVGEDLRNEMYQRDLRQQSQNTIALQQQRLDLEKTRNIKDLLDQHSAINFDLNITPEEARRKRKDLDTRLRLERARKYTRESFVKRGDAYDPARFEQVPMYEGKTLIGTARVDVEALGYRPSSVQKAEVEGALSEQKGQMMMFDQERHPKGCSSPSTKTVMVSGWLLLRCTTTICECCIQGICHLRKSFLRVLRIPLQVLAK